ncbi:hypothetical protein, partial [Methylocaldum sp.]|uniref:hypothetical protein n=1 Tax=Methylocaldum sp. TaxID=1969727 RepID=UPI00322053B2
MNPEHREVTRLCHPWLLDPGIPCRGDVLRLNLTALSEVQLFLFTGFIEMPKTLFQRGDSSPRTVNMLASVGIFSLISS